METIRMASDVMLALNLVNGLALLFMQFAAYRQHHHHSFLLLSISTVTGLISLTILAVPLFLPEARNWYPVIVVIGTALYAVCATLCLWGVASLFRSYSAVRQGV